MFVFCFYYYYFLNLILWLLLLSWCLMSSDVIWHIRDKLWPMPKHGSIRKVYACLAVTCHLHFWQNDRDFLRATVVTRGWNGYRNKSQHRKSTLEKKILPPFQQGFEPATFQSRVRRSNHWAIPAPLDSLDTKPCFYKYPCEKIALLCLGSWSQQQFRNLLNVCPDHNYLLQCVTFYSQTLFGDASSWARVSFYSFFRPADSFATKLGLMLHHHD